MLSFRLPHVLRPIAVTAAALTLAVTPVIAETNPDVEQQLLDQIQETLSRAGPNAIALLDPLTTLGRFYQEGEDHTFALAALEQALHILRVNRGLHTLDQVPLVGQLIRIEEARGNSAGAWEREQELLTLLRRYPNDLRTVPVLTQIADKQMEVLGAVIAGKKPPQVVLGCFYRLWSNGDDSGCRSGSRKTVVQGMLAEAHRNYSDAIGILLRNGHYDSDALPDLEMAMLRSVDMMRSRYGSRFALVPAIFGAASIEPWRSRIASVAALAAWDLPYPLEILRNDGERHTSIEQLRRMDPYERGRERLLRLSAYAAATEATPLRQASAVAQIADWDLLYSRNGQALDTYEAAAAMLMEGAGAEASIEQLFAPAMPVVLPAFRPNPLAADDTRPATGHVDVAFEITRYGRGRQIVIIDAASASRDETNQVVSLIKNHRFRPRLTNGEFADATPVEVRFYLYE